MPKNSKNQGGTLTITGGRYKGRKIETPGGKTHPMGERERLAIMNAVAPYIEDAYVLDAYAGSGILGIEAISRGAREVYFLDNDKNAIKTIKNNLRELSELKVTGFPMIADVKTTQFLPMSGWGVAFFDPPYDKMKEFNVDQLYDFPNTYAIVVSHPKDYKIPDLPGFSRKDKTFASANITIFTNEEI